MVCMYLQVSKCHSVKKLYFQCRFMHLCKKKYMNVLILASLSLPMETALVIEMLQVFMEGRGERTTERREWKPSWDWLYWSASNLMKSDVRCSYLCQLLEYNISGSPVPTKHNCIETQLSVHAIFFLFRRFVLEIGYLCKGWRKDLALSWSY